MESTSSPRRSSSPTPPDSPRPEPLSTFDRLFILFASVTGSMLTYKSIRPGFFQKGLSFSILAGGAAYALGINCKCCKKTIESIFNGFDGCSLGGASDRCTFYPGFPRQGGWGSKGGTTPTRGGRYEGRDGEHSSDRVGGHSHGSPSTHTAHNHGQRKRFEERD